MRPKPLSRPRTATRRITLVILIAAGLSVTCLDQSARAAAGGSSGNQRHVLLTLRHPSAALARFVAAVSNPASPEYRHYETIEQLVRRFGATRAARRVVLRWLHAHRVHGRLDPTATYVDVALTPGQKRVLFPASGNAARAGGRARSLPVPRALAGSVTGVADGRLQATAASAARGADVVGRIATAPFNSRGSSIHPRTGTPAGCPAGAEDDNGSTRLLSQGFIGFTPNQYLTAYGFPRLIDQDLRGSGERIAVVETGGFQASDIATFARCFQLPRPHLRVIPVGVPHQLPPLDETTLDLEVLAGAAPRASSIDVYEGTGASVVGFVNTIAEPLRQRSRRPNVESISYSFCEARLDGQVMGLREANTVLEFEAASGISVFAASGDTGSPGCSEGDNSAALPLLSVGFPASSPYATAVGGTSITLTDANRIATEVVWNNSPLTSGAGGGGTSLLFDRPSWQSVGGTTGPTREVPDVSMLAEDVPGYAIFCTPPACPIPPGSSGTGWVNVGGTSAATPLLAGGVADADQEAARHHQPPLGFVNPLLYDGAAMRRVGVIRGVARGNNDLGRQFFGTPLGCCTAHAGYNDAAGLGSVNVDAFSRAALHAYRTQLVKRAR